MQSRFGREDLQIEVYVRELLKLILSNTTTPNKLDIASLYDQIETQLRALETLGITTDKCSAMLFPLIESCLPRDLLKEWQRSVGFDLGSERDTSTSLALEIRLKKSHITLMCSEIPVNKTEKSCDKSDVVKDESTKNQTLANNSGTQIFLQTLRVTLKGPSTSKREQKVCGVDEASFGYLYTRCQVWPKHDIILSMMFLDKLEQFGKAVLNIALTVQSFASHSSQKRSGYAPVRNCAPDKDFIGKFCFSFELYIVAERHTLFGGKEVSDTHQCYDVTVQNNMFSYTFEALDQRQICSDVVPILRGQWMEETKTLGIEISDIEDYGLIELFLGADVSGILYTGGRRVLTSGLVAFETRLGWTLTGKMQEASSGSRSTHSNMGVSTLNLFVKNASISDLWELEAIGIRGPSDKPTKQEQAIARRTI
ncbi:hypothetical protein NQ315_003702 [Exocentrus adspersus]|uniref:Peptidase aspartic putative domain-containing protein n=1 Tax=Exocentrus adspersus TaxID=1586481 RepID=A0AAV8V6P5_9CUCU|nr:hypothetical protein NQ315_003702 [Exocentrus adspersus]